MHGEITLESALDHGTKATFCIPFNKPQFTGSASPLVDLGSIPERLRSEMSVSGVVSEYERGSRTPPQSPPDSLAVALPFYPQRRDSSSNRPRSKHPSTTDLHREFSVQDFDRQKTHVLIVEDK